ncbi:hypothetical protein F2Q69_00050047 [Brassica cretica]|uniref:Uncharacterized protein n=1 Tax=Brassica cretica TaxID=69181 RepID=A0A8S9PPS7_BRACR|nr:hypothetical protein F2Q69_00050047 [Brassica cretica]
MVEFTVELTGPVQKADGPYSVLGTGVFKALALGALGMFERRRPMMVFSLAAGEPGVRKSASGDERRVRTHNGI